MRNENQERCQVQRLNQLREKFAELPAAYIIKKDGIFGEWSAWRDDWLGTIISGGCTSKRFAILACWNDAGYGNQVKEFMDLEEQA